MAVKRFSNSLISQSGQDKVTNFIAGYSPAVDEMDLIQRVTIGATPQNSVEFTSIPQTYQHLQIRQASRSSASSYIQNIRIEFNSDTITTNYWRHLIHGDGVSTVGTGGSDANGLYFFYSTGSLALNSLGISIIDILDYTNTSKNKVLRGLGGIENNNTGGSSVEKGYIHMTSGMWTNTSSINSIKLITTVGNFVQPSTFSLYGVIA